MQLLYRVHSLKVKWNLFSLDLQVPFNLVASLELVLVHLLDNLLGIDLQAYLMQLQHLDPYPC